MAAVSELLDLIEAKVADLLPGYRPMPFTYDVELNERLQTKNYGIRLGSGSSASGLNKCVTVDHNIEVDLIQRWEPKKSLGDKHLRDCIKEISTDLETVYKELYRRPGNIPSATLLLIAPLDLSAPTIDNDNNLVTITLTLSVKYRVLN